MKYELKINSKIENVNFRFSVARILIAQKLHYFYKFVPTAGRRTVKSGLPDDRRHMFLVMIFSCFARMENAVRSSSRGLNVNDDDI